VFALVRLKRKIGLFTAHILDSGVNRTEMGTATRDTRKPRKGTKQE